MIIKLLLQTNILSEAVDGHNIIRGRLCMVWLRRGKDSLSRQPSRALAHVNPKRYERKALADLSSDKPWPSSCSMWFVGLHFKQKKGNLNVDLTESIGKFDRKLHFHAASIRFKSALFKRN